MTREEFDNIRVGDKVIHRVFNGYYDYHNNGYYDYHNSIFYATVIKRNSMYISVKFIDASLHETSNEAEFELVP